MKKVLKWMVVFFAAAFLTVLVQATFMPFLASRSYRAEWVEISFKNGLIHAFAAASNGWICSDGTSSGECGRNRMACLRVPPAWFVFKIFRPSRPPPLELYAFDLLYQPTPLEDVRVEYSHDPRTQQPYQVLIKQSTPSQVTIYLDRQ